MSAARLGDLQRQYASGIGDGDAAGDAGEIHGIANAGAVARSGPDLAPDLDADVAAPEEAYQRDPVLAMVAGVLGAQLTTDNPAWRGDPVPVMRSLQKMLVAHSLTLPEDRRAPALGAIRAVELAVRWRLRWIQMRRSEAESHFIQPQDHHATAPPP